MSDTDSDPETRSGTLETMRPNPAWNADAHEETVAALAADGLVFRVWGGDWCGDCRGQLPDFAAALDAAGVSEDRVHQYPVEKEADGSKTGPLVDDYDVDRIPTVVVERDGDEVARYVETAPVPIAIYLAERLRE
ncbi:thioredoxin [Halobellus sp. Atlit-31R]|nr:thioredoxin [Halobellus sp. Atlit-31R]